MCLATRIAFASFAAFICGIASVAQECKALGPSTAVDSELESYVYDGLAELTLIKSKVLKKFTYLAKGEMIVSQPAEAAGVTPFYIIKTVDKANSYTYDALCEVRLAALSGEPVDVELWTEYLQAGTLIKGSRGPINKQRLYTEPTEGQDAEEYKEQRAIRICYFDPFDDILLVANSIWSTRPTGDAVTSYFLSKYEFVGVERGVQDQIVSTWSFNRGDGVFTIKLHQSKSVKYLPVKVSYEMRNDRYKFFSETTVRWEEQDALLLPVYVQASCPSNGGKGAVNQEWLIELDWRIGDKVPDSFFDASTRDLRIPSSVEFNVGFWHVDESGALITSSWETPAEIESALLRRSNKPQSGSAAR